MKTYFITLSPLDAYFFGGDITFDSGEKKNYFVRSEVFPQQTSILGMLRYQILVKRNLLSPIPNSKDLIDAKKKVGGESFTAGSDMPQSFGYIESISPIFLYHKSDKKPYFIAPLDTFISENKDYKIFPRKSRASFFTLKNETVNPLYELLGTSGDDETPYSSKYELRKGFVSTDQSFSLEADLFINDERVGIIKEGTLRSNKDEGYYRQVYKRMKETDLCFAFYVRLKDGHGITSEEVFLGAERSMFYLNIDEHTSPNTPIEDVFETLLKANFKDDSIPEYHKVILLSPARVDLETMSKHLVAGIYEQVTHRFIQTNLGKTTKWVIFKKGKSTDEAALTKSERQHLLSTGSVLFVKKSNLNALLETLNNPGFKKIGYNYYHVL
mgnify:FL=1